MKMTNAEKFKQIFGLYATELWAMPGDDFLAWLNRDVETTQPDKENLSNFCPNCGARLQEGQDKDLGWTILSKSIIPTLVPAGVVAGIVQNQIHIEESIHRIKQLTGISIDDLIDLLAQGYELKAPSAQPQIIRCKDCKHRDKYGCCKYWKGLAMADIPIATDDNDFCSYAEQKGEQCERKL